MRGKPASVEDYVSIQNLMGVYQWLVDEGDEEGYADLFTEDGAFIGLPEVFGPPESFRGREGVKKVAALMQFFGGKARHLIGSFSVRYGDTRDEAFARYYALVTTWVKEEGPRFNEFALVTTHLVRIDGEWKIKTNTAKTLKEEPNG